MAMSKLQAVECAAGVEVHKYSREVLIQYNPNQTERCLRPHGHIVCELCFKNFKKRSIKNKSNRYRYVDFRGNFKFGQRNKEREDLHLLEPSALAQSLGRKNQGGWEYVDVKVPCQIKGCPFVFKTSDFLTHLSKCPYGSVIACFEKKTMDCQRKVYLKDLYEHLKDDHHCVDIAPLDTASPGKFIISSFTNEVDPPHLCYWPVCCLKYEGNIFLSHMAKNSGGIFRWVTVIGGQKEADKYQYSCKVTSTSTSTADADSQAKIKKNVEFMWTLPVLPLQGFDYHDFKMVQDSGLFAGMHPHAHQPVCYNRKVGTVVYKYAWDTEIVLMKIKEEV